MKIHMKYLLLTLDLIFTTPTHALSMQYPISAASNKRSFPYVELPWTSPDRLLFYSPNHFAAQFFYRGQIE
ncbi:hypothetical protein [Amantichitinum ursilacus]|uniref:Uncharacterized protein n=1 Tax=Amantichitinum ursilacus TaxID=857265 RepID=A0A0N0GL55_9NEIS|nr:hypothetical protein [Amantichitinum ursilacus]KPC49616.1 hypothetical protein WG78_19875 [Amantichitinum ursilacus]